MKTLIGIAAVAGLALAAQAGTVNYGWEDGVGTILGSYGNLSNPTNVSSPEPVYAGDHALRVTESPNGSTPQAYVAYIEGLTDGDVIDASFFGYDLTPGASPSLRIWGHYALSGDVTSYAGSAGGNTTYTDGTGWNQVAWSWTFDSDGGTRDALVVEVRLYSPTGEEPDFYIDDLEVTSSAGTITVPVPAPGAMALLGLGGLVAVRRRR
jgi:MYXO-CTERM domain-containing protein